MEIELKTQEDLKRDLARDLGCLLSSLVVYKFLSHSYHWNVRGKDFPEFHDFFAMLYEDAEDAIDPTAENLRKIGFNAPGMLEDYLAMSCINVKPAGFDPESMCVSLYSAQKELSECYYKTFDSAIAANQQGIADFIAGRIDTNDKWIWQLGAVIGADSTQIG